jgi:hypothetical protein
MRLMSRQPRKSCAIKGLLGNDREERMKEFLVASMVSLNQGRIGARTSETASTPSLGLSYHPGSACNSSSHPFSEGCPVHVVVLGSSWTGLESVGHYEKILRHRPGLLLVPISQERPRGSADQLMQFLRALLFVLLSCQVG